jgi:hypothetical protein
MPTPSNFTADADNRDLISACESVLVDFATTILISENPIVYPNAGYRAYQKRMLTAAKVKKNSVYFGKQMADLVCRAIPNFMQERVNNNEIIFNYLWNNRACEWDVTNIYNGANPTGIGRQLFDSLSDVDASDLL